VSSFFRVVTPVPDLRHHSNKADEACCDAEQQEDNLQGVRPQPSVEQITDAVTDQDRYRKDHSDTQNEIELLERASFVVLFAIHATF
jgi:hypothetical protein